MVANGHDVSWIVQNPAYSPKVSGQRVLQIPFPKSSDLHDGPVPEAVITDRGRTYFDAGQRHYTYYQNRLEAAVTELRPDVVIGEPTLFHELLTVGICRARGIPYLHPTINRYPSGRFMILDGDTQTPIEGSGEHWDDATLDALTEAVVTGKSLPSYMRVASGLEKQIRRFHRGKALARTVLGRWRGERFNTPSIGRKLKLGRNLKSNLAAWADLERAPDTDGPVLLYPLQMQPEANIDVWGRPFSDQIGFIERILAALPEGGQIAVKANPKSKYEVSDDLIVLARRDARVVLLPLDWRMPRAHEVTNGAITVSGTVGYEAVFGRGRCISLRHPVIQKLFPACHADTPEDAVQRLLADPTAGDGGRDATKKLLRCLIFDSFPGTINEPAYDLDCVSQENVARVSAAFTQIISTIDRREISE